MESGGNLSDSSLLLSTLGSSFFLFNYAQVPDTVREFHNNTTRLNEGPEKIKIEEKRTADATRNNEGSYMKRCRNATSKPIKPIKKRPIKETKKVAEKFMEKLLRE